MAGAQQRQQVVDGRADLAKVALDVRERRRPDRDHDVVGLGGVGRAVGQLQPPAALDAIEQRLRAGLVERHLTGPDRGQHGRVVIHPQYS